ncbi:MAG: hypothetical protein HeimC3_23450 [Candidatus Heimdallarchaeota archaeon LC_3]|nr:MAG: hypothetical protein HeimC3_23450 [Candidatus Heimdallarchaeota archaeon LC_3]
MSDYENMSREWQICSNIKAKLKGLYEFKQIKPWKGPLGKQEIVRNEGYKGISEFSKDFKSVISSLTTKSLLAKFIFGLDWIPSAEYFSKSPYALFLPKDLTSENNVEVLSKTRLIHGNYGNKYIVISSGHDFDLYTSAIDFFYRFRFLLPRSRTHRPLLLRDVTGLGGNKVFLFFSSVKGHGLLIKILDTEYGGGINKELDIMRVGKIIGANIPSNAVVIHNTGSAMFKSLGKENFFVQTLTPVVKHFREASKEDLSEVAQFDSKNLGKIFVFGIVCGSWDRHSGNYLINRQKNKYSLQEIDFGLFLPDFYKTKKFVPDDESRQQYPLKYEKLLGWAITRHQKVDKIIKETNEKKFLIGVKASINNLYKVLKGKDPILKGLVGERLFKRTLGLFRSGNPTQNLLFSELEDLKLNVQAIKEYLCRFNL